MKLEVFDGFGKGPIYFRDGTSDSAILQAMFFNQRKEYYFPEELMGDCRTILDIGANTGIVAVVMANFYPEAIIHCFEPEEQNLEILRRNLEKYDNARIHNVALGNSDRDGWLYDSEDAWNFGGYSLLAGPGNTKEYRTVKVVETNRYLDSIGVSSPDLIKIDCEGSEHEILTQLRATRLSGVRYLLGELHGHRDFELLQYLQTWFDLGLEKQMANRTWHFSARRKR